MSPSHHDAHVGRIRVYVARGELDNAVRAGRELVRRDARPRSQAFLGYALAQDVQKDEARQILDSLKKSKERVPTFPLVVLHVALGEHDEALRLLEKAVETREYALRLKTEPVLDPLRSHPRFEALLRRAGFQS